MLMLQTKWEGRNWHRELTHSYFPYAVLVEFAVNSCRKKAVQKPGLSGNNILIHLKL